MLERELQTDTVYLLRDPLTLVGLFVLPSGTSLGMTPEGQEMLKKAADRGMARANGGAAAVVKVRAAITPHVGKCVEHARKWVETHRPRY